MKPFIQNERAFGNMAFISIVIILSLLVAGGMSNLLSIGVNTVLDIHNDNVESGIATEQTADNLIFAKNVFRILSIFTLLGVLFWAKNHSTVENTMVDATLLIGSIIVMYIFTFVSMILVLGYGMSLDIFLDVINNIDITASPGSPWENAPDGSFALNLFYVLLQVPMFVGILAFFAGAVRKTTGESIGVQFDEFQTQEFD